MSNTSSSSCGIGFTGLLTILFVGLKLADVIDWSWWWVLSPLWLVPAAILSVLACISTACLCVMMLSAAIDAWDKSHRRSSKP